MVSLSTKAYAGKNKINSAKINNKKVLLRERKRHTARRVASNPYIVLTGYSPPAGHPPGQGTPPQPGYPPWPGYPPPGYPPARVPPLGRVPPSWTWQGTPPAAPWHSGKCCKVLWDMGTPPVDRQIDGWMEGQTRVKTLPSRRTTYTGGKKTNASSEDRTQDLL